MSKGKTRKATLKDVKIIYSLVLYYADKKEMLPRSLNEIYENIRDFVVLEADGIVRACSCLHVCWEALAEIKSLAVEEGFTGRGYGRRLIEFELEEARELGATQIFALTFVPKFFEKLGFKVVDKDTLPKKVWSECIRCVHFPNCDEVAVVCDLV
ncbi:MAG: N-acetyltransferase [bacterium]